MLMIKVKVKQNKQAKTTTENVLAPPIGQFYLTH